LFGKRKVLFFLSFPPLTNLTQERTHAFRFTKRKRRRGGGVMNRERRKEGGGQGS
jgi:hypothetical protein